MTKRFLFSCCLLAAVMVGGHHAQAGNPGEPVAAFTIVGPPIVEVDTPFEISVIANDANWSPTIPQSGATVTLSAHIVGSGEPVLITPTSFSALGSGIDQVTVSLGEVAPGTPVAIQATGYGVFDPSGPNAPDILVVTSSEFGTEANRFEISVPCTANPNVAFPIYITPVEATGPEGSETREATGYVGDLVLISQHGGISPTSVSLNLVAGASHMVMVTLDSVRSDNMIHVAFPLPNDGLAYEVSFTNDNTAQLSNSSDFVVHSQVYQDDTPLSAQGVTDQSVWQSKIWPFSDTENFGAGYNMLTLISGIGPNGAGLEFLTKMIPSSVARETLPGDLTFWSGSPVSIALNTEGGWNLEEGSDPFPGDLAGSYWVRRTFFSNGNFAPGQKFVSTFTYDSAEFDVLLDIVEPDGVQDSESEDEPIANFGVDSATWDATIWCVPAIADTVYHIIAEFDLPHESGNGIESIAIYMTYTSSGRVGGPSEPGAFVPDSTWNEAFIVNRGSEFLNITGDPVPLDLDGSYWTRIGLLDGGDEGDDVGWSKYINTTGQHIAPNQLHVENTVGGPGDVVSVEVSINLEQGEDAAGVQFDIAAGEGAEFQGAINHQPNFQISTSNPAPGVTRVLMVSLNGASTGGDEAGHHVLMQLIYELDSELSYGDQIALNVSGSIISDPESNSLPHDVWNAYIQIGERGDLSGNDGVIDVTDLTALIRIILELDETPDPETFAFFQADINDDGDIDILDAVRMINIILGNATAKPVAGPTGPVQLDLATPVVTTDGQTAIPVFAQFDGSVAGLQLTFAYDPALVSIGTAIPSGVLDGMTVEQHAKDGKLTLLVYSMDGRTFQASSITGILNLPVSFNGSDGGDVSLLAVVVADPQAESVPVTLTNGTVKVSSNPGAFALQNNRPNPFNPSTQISYDVPEQARITVSIFNVLGQEIVRLVDQVQSPGRYVVTWNGRNSDGLGVSSGVYMYRLSSSTGYSDTRRMTLLK